MRFPFKKFCLVFFALLAFTSCQTKTAEITVSSNNISNVAKNSETQNPESEIQTYFREMLENAESFEILSLNENDKKSKFFEKFYIEGTPVYGNKLIKVTDKQKRKQLLEDFYEDVKKGSSADMAACFTPHHTIKAKYKNKYILIAICFECSKLYGKVSNKGFNDNSLDEKGETSTYSPIVNISKSKSLHIFDEIISNQ